MGAGRDMGKISASLGAGFIDHAQVAVQKDAAFRIQ